MFIYYTLLLAFMSAPLFGGGGESKPVPPVSVLKNDTTKKVGTGEVEINVHINNISNNDNSARAYSSNQNNISATQTIKEIYDQLKGIDPKLYYTGIIDWLGKNRQYIGYSLTVASYSAICAWLINENRFLEAKDGWSCWRRDLSTRELYALPQGQFAEMLLKGVQSRFLNRSNPTDFVLPLVRFVQTIEHEETRLKRYVTLVSWIQSCKLLFFFPTNEKLLDKAKKRLKRLAILNEVFVNWTSEYNVLMALQGPARRKLGAHVTRQQCLTLSHWLTKQHTLRRHQKSAHPLR